MRLGRATLAVGLAILRCGCMATTLPLATPPNTTTPAADHNAAGIAHYKASQWAIAREHFVLALEADPHLAEAHFNLARTLDKLNRHTEATTHFKKAAALAPNNTAITQSSAYRRHTAPGPTTDKVARSI